MKKYKTIFVNSNGLKSDTEELDRVISVHSNNECVLHSVMPRVSEGRTEGYILIFDSTKVECIR